MNNKNVLVSSTAIYALSSVTTSAIPFLLLPILTRYLTPGEYGIVAMFSIWLSILGVFVGLSVQGAVNVRYFDRERINIQEYVSGCLYILMVSTLVVLCVAFALKGMLQQYTSVPDEWLLTGVLVSGMQFIVLVRLSLWQVAKLPLKYGGLQITQSVFNAALSVWLVVVAGMLWEGRLYAIFLSTAVVSILAMISLWQDGYIKPRLNYSYIKDALQFGIPLIPHVLGGMVLVVADRLIITNILGVDQAGIYTVALQIGMVLNIATIAFNQAYAPWLYEQLKEADERQMRRIVNFTYLYFIIAVGIALIFGLFASELMKVIAGDRFQEASTSIPYIAFGYSFGGMYFMVTNYVFYARATARLAFNTFAVGLVHIMLTFLLVLQSGQIGAAQSFMLAQILLFLGTWRLASRVHPMPWLKCFKGRT